MLLACSDVFLCVVVVSVVVFLDCLVEFGFLHRQHRSLCMFSWACAFALGTSSFVCMLNFEFVIQPICRFGDVLLTLNIACVICMLVCFACGFGMFASGFRDSGERL